MSISFFHYKAIYFPFVINKHFLRKYFESVCIYLLIKLYQLLSLDVSWLDSLLLWWLPNGCFLILSLLLQRWVGILLKGKFFLSLFRNIHMFAYMDFFLIQWSIVYFYYYSVFGPSMVYSLFLLHLLWCSNYPRWASGECFKLVSVFFWHASIILFFSFNFLIMAKYMKHKIYHCNHF